MVRFLLLALACVVAAQGGFVAFADQLGVPGFGDHLAALTVDDDRQGGDRQRGNGHLGHG